MWSLLFSTFSVRNRNEPGCLAAHGLSPIWNLAEGGAETNHAFGRLLILLEIVAKIVANVFFADQDLHGVVCGRGIERGQNSS